MSRSVGIRRSVEAQRVLQHHLTTRGSIVWLAEGNSMWPWILSGTRVEIERCNPTQIAKGDTVLFGRQVGFGLHRVIDKTQAGVITRGDAHAYADGEVPFGAVLGKVKGLVVGGLVWTNAPVWLVRFIQRIVVHCGGTVRMLRTAWRVIRTPLPRFAR